MNELEKKFYARHLTAIEKPSDRDVKHWKYISKKRGPNGKWQYKYKESNSTNKLTGRTDHEYTMTKTSEGTTLDRTPSYEVVDETTKVRVTYDQDTKEFKFDFADGYVDENAHYNVEKAVTKDGENHYEYTYTRDGKQYKTTVSVKAATNNVTKFETRDVTADTLLEKAAEKAKNYFKKKKSDVK